MRPFLQLENVKKTLFGLCNKLFDVNITKLSTKEMEKLNITTWNKSVDVY